ncbi:MAG: hypothetical protein V1670_04100 [Candidatus Omnitrophota bacterium]
MMVRSSIFFGCPAAGIAAGSHSYFIGCDWQSSCPDIRDRASAA